jgi:N-acetylglucosamine kinase-like BadF-type ATPase
LFVDVGGTKTQLNSDHVNRKFPSAPSQLPARLRKIISATAKIDQLVVGIRGVWTSAEKNVWKRQLAGLAPKLTILSDIELSHRRAFGETEPGIVLSAGTGSVAFGRNARGKTARAGGLGVMLGDEGSGFWIGKMWLKRHFEERGDWQTVRAFVKRDDAVRAIAGLANSILVRASKKPKSVERQIAIDAVRHLSRLIWQVRRELKMNNAAPIHLVGGLFEHRWFKREFLKRCY